MREIDEIDRVEHVGHRGALDVVGVLPRGTAQLGCSSHDAIDRRPDGSTSSSEPVAAAEPSGAGGLYSGGVLSDTQIADFHRDGFVVVEGFASTAACAALRQRALEIVDAFEPTAKRTVFTTDQQERVSNDEFLRSGSTTWCFFEQGAIDDGGEIVGDKRLAINKIGHAMHDLDPVFEAFTYTPELAAAANAIGMRDPLAVQSMYIFKQPMIGGEVGCHQDATFLWTDPITVTGFWFAIEDATLDNGCLWAKPGGHTEPLRQRFERAGSTDDDGSRFTVLDGSPLPSPGDGLVPLEVPAGTLVILHGLLPHWSDVNRSPRSRHAYTLHCIEADVEWPAFNWLQRPAELPFRSLPTVADARYAAVSR